MSRSAVACAVILIASLISVAVPQTVHAANVPGTSCSVFPADNIWNTDISQLPVNPNSATWINSTRPTSGLTHPDFGRPPYGIPFNIAHNNDLHYSFNFQYWDESDPVVATQQPQGPYPVPVNPLIEGPTDSHMLVINADTCKLYETFATNLTTTPFSGGSGAIFDLGSNQLRPAGWTSADAAGLPIFPGLLRFDEVQAGFIGHAIRFTVHNTDNTYLWPARHRAGINDPTLPPMGARFRLKTSYNDPTLSTEAQVVMTAFKHYGLIVADNGSNWYFQGTEDSSWDDQLIADLKRIPVDQFEAIDESSLMIDPNSAQAGTAPAAATAPTAAPRAAGATVTWSAPASGGQPITSYTIIGSPSGQAVVGGGVTTAVVYGLTNGITYTFTVQASNVIGTAPPSPPSNPVTPLARLTAQSQSGAPPGRQPIQQSTPSSAGPRVPAKAPSLNARPLGPPSPSPLPGSPTVLFAPRAFFLR